MPYICIHCSKKFILYFLYKLHLKQKHKQSESPPAESCSVNLFNIDPSTYYHMAGASIEMNGTMWENGF